MTDKSAEHLQQQIDSANSYIEELQTKVAFQEYTIEALNDALSSQQKQLDMSLTALSLSSRLILLSSQKKPRLRITRTIEAH